jgi:hypothetical protein
MPYARGYIGGGVVLDLQVKIAGRAGFTMTCQDRANRLPVVLALVFEAS